MQSRPVDAYLHNSDVLARLASHAAHLRAIDECWREIVPASLKALCAVANLRSGTVVIKAHNGAIAAKLKQLLPSLLSTLQARGFQVTGIHISVQPIEASYHTAGRGGPQATPGTLGGAARLGLAALAENLPKEAGLRTALENLLKTSQKG